MASQAISNYRDNAEIYHGDVPCKKMIAELLEEVGLPLGLLPLEDLQEVGYNRAAGFLWMVQKKKREHTFKAIKETVSYATEVTALVEARKIKKVTGVKVRELLLWLSVVEVYVADPASGKVTFKTGTGLSDSARIRTGGVIEKLEKDVQWGKRSTYTRAVYHNIVARP